LKQRDSMKRYKLVGYWRFWTTWWELAWCT